MRLHISDESGMLLDTGGGGRQPPIGFQAMSLCCSIMPTYIPMWILLKCLWSMRRRASMPRCLPGHRATSRYLLFDKNMRMHGWTDIRSGRVRPERLDISGLATMAFGGVHIVSPRLVEDICRYGRDNGKIVFSITDYYIESCGRMYIKGWCQSAGTNWHDIGTLDKLRRAEDCLGGGVRL